MALAWVFHKQLLSAAVSAAVLGTLMDSPKTLMFYLVAQGKEKPSQRHQCVSRILDPPVQVQGTTGAKA